MDQIRNTGNLSDSEYLSDGDQNEFFDKLPSYTLSKTGEFHASMPAMLLDIS